MLKSGQIKIIENNNFVTLDKGKYLHNQSHYKWQNPVNTIVVGPNTSIKLLVDRNHILGTKTLLNNDYNDVILIIDENVMEFSIDSLAPKPIEEKNKQEQLSPKNVVTEGFSMIMSMKTIVSIIILIILIIVLCGLGYFIYKKKM
jgi:hypothetical protein